MSDIIEIDGVEYDEDDVITLEDGDLCPIDDAVECQCGEHSGEWHRRDDCTLTDLDGWVHEDDVITAEDGNTMASGNEGDHYYYYTHDGYLYPEDDVVYAEDTCEHYHVDDIGNNVFWHESEGCYYTHEPDGSNCHPYHNGFRNDYTTPDTIFRFGVEVEKDDEGLMCSEWALSDVDDTGWCREDDSSLNDGFELVSPTYDLFDDRFDNDINGDNFRGKCLRNHINADYTYKTCGGHMSFSVVNKTGRHIYDLYSGFMPFLFSLYHQRLGRTYSKLKTSAELKCPSGYDKYNAVRVHRNHIEFRIISAVPNVKTLFWRRDLLRIMAKHQKQGIGWWIAQALDESTPLHQHLINVYSVDRIKQLMVVAAAIGKAMNGRDYDKYVSYADEDEVERSKNLVDHYVSQR
jgi:hypothetical protein